MKRAKRAKGERLLRGFGLGVLASLALFAGGLVVGAVTAIALWARVRH